MPDQFAQGCYISKRFIRTPDIRFRYNFQQWHSGTVVIDIGIRTTLIMQAFAGVFFYVNTVQTYAPGCFPKNNIYITVFANWCCVLRDLVALWQVWIEIIFPSKIVVLHNITMAGKA